MTNQYVDWTERELEVCKKAWIAGHSASEIARTLPGRSRNSVIGIVTRRGWLQAARQAPAAPARMPKVAVVKPPKAPKVKAALVRTAPRPGPQNKPGAAFGFMSATTHAEALKKRAEAVSYGQKVIDAFVTPANDDAIPLLERRFGQCSWPVGEPERAAQQLCCGRRITGERTKSTATYCDTHRQKAAPFGVPQARDLMRSVRRAA